MPKLLIVEDEPAAGRYIRSLIEQRRPAFSVVGIAENGRDALERVRDSAPDLVITDVKMPVMDGIELVAALKAEFPELPAVIVSGHQEFEYARRALDTGVVDYLLKPVDPHRLEEVLDKLGALLSTRAWAREARRLARLIDGSPLDEAEAPAGGEEYRVAVLRVGALPPRFLLEGSSKEAAAGEEGFCVLPGCDPRQWIYLGRASAIDRDGFAARVRRAAEAAGGPYRTLLFLPEPVGAIGLRAAACGACRDADSLVVPGLSRDFERPTDPGPEPAWDKTLSDRIEFALAERRPDLLEKAVREKAAAWRAGQAALLSAESQLRPIIQLILRKAPRADESMPAELEFLLEEVFSSILDYRDLEERAVALAFRAAGFGPAAGQGDPCRSVPGFFNSILRYVEGSYSEPLNLGSLSVTFRISSSYLSKLFRQHTHSSFGEFLSAIRIGAAKRLIRESPGMPLKDVAERVGFNDPYYFSRVFKSIAGLPPSDYSRACLSDASRPAE